MSLHTFIVARHGNADGDKLVPQAIKDLEQLADEMLKGLGNIKPLLFSAPRKRCTQSSYILGNILHVPYIIVPELSEDDINIPQQAVTIIKHEAKAAEAIIVMGHRQHTELLPSVFCDHLACRCRPLQYAQAYMIDCIQGEPHLIGISSGDTSWKKF